VAHAQTPLAPDALVRQISTEVIDTVKADKDIQAGNLGKIIALVESAQMGKAPLQQLVDKVSAIGIGMRSHAGVAARAFRALADKGINIRAITTSEIKFSVLIDAAYTELAVRTLHTLYGLDNTA
jgi:aspartate kinase